MCLEIRINHALFFPGEFTTSAMLHDGDESKDPEENGGRCESSVYFG